MSIKAQRRGGNPNTTAPKPTALSKSKTPQPAGTAQTKGKACRNPWLAAKVADSAVLGPGVKVPTAARAVKAKSSAWLMGGQAPPALKRRDGRFVELGVTLVQLCDLGGIAGVQAAVAERGLGFFLLGFEGGDQLGQRVEFALLFVAELSCFD